MLIGAFRAIIKKPLYESFDNTLIRNIKSHKNFFKKMLKIQIFLQNFLQTANMVNDYW